VSRVPKPVNVQGEPAGIGAGQFQLALSGGPVPIVKQMDGAQPGASAKLGSICKGLQEELAGFG
jgi:hypothetical protein